MGSVAVHFLPRNSPPPMHTFACMTAHLALHPAHAPPPSLLQGKLLALELLTKVLQNPLHAWDHVREPFCRQLRQPLCLALLRNCASPDPTAFQLAVRLLTAILALPRVRLGLRAELGAFYPLLVLRPLEQVGAELVGGGCGGV